MDMPLVQAILDYANEDTVRLHIPGHKGRDLFSRSGIELDWAYDLTEVAGTDNLQAPTGAIGQAQRHAARAFGSDVCFFLVNGTTSGIHIMMMYGAQLGQRVIVPRNCHKSVWDALILSGAVPVYIQPEYDKDGAMFTQIAPSTVERIVARNQDVHAIVLTSPNYYGMVPHLKQICSILSAHDIISLVDEAHGAHFMFSDFLPPSAATCGADIWVQSAHKTLPSLTQTSYLHASGHRVDQNRLRQLHSMMMSTSPSYLLMASLDWARAYMEQKGEVELDRLIGLIDKTKRRLSSLGIDTMDDYKRPEIAAMDPTRLVLDLSQLGLTGFEGETILRSRGIQVEMSDFHRLVCVCSVADKQEDFDRLINACGALAEHGTKKSDIGSRIHIFDEIPQQQLSPREAFYSGVEYVQLNEACGRICAGLVGAYPPGIPKYCYGELIDKAGIEGLIQIRAMGGHLFGVNDEDLIPVVS